VNKLAVDIGGTKCGASLLGTDKSLELATADYQSPAEIMSDITKWGRSLGEGAFEAIGVSFGGPFDFDSQTVTRSIHVSGWEGFSFRDWAKKEFGVVAVADNDANLGALGEWVARDKKPQSLVYVTVSTGIGAGLVIDGRLYRGAANSAGELGHITIDPDGPEDEMGNRGTLERLCSGYWLLKDYGKPASELLQDDEFLESYARNLSIGISNLIRILNPEIVVIGGGIAKTGARLEKALQKNMANLLSISGTRLELSTLGNQNVLLGAGELANDELRL
jgi:glucokinase